MDVWWCLVVGRAFAQVYVRTWLARARQRRCVEGRRSSERGPSCFRSPIGLCVMVSVDEPHTNIRHRDQTLSSTHRRKQRPRGRHALLHIPTPIPRCRHRHRLAEQPRLRATTRSTATRRLPCNSSGSGGKSAEGAELGEVRAAAPVLEEGEAGAVRLVVKVAGVEFPCLFLGEKGGFCVGGCGRRWIR